MEAVEAVEKNKKIWKKWRQWKQWEKREKVVSRAAADYVRQLKIVTRNE